MHGATTSASALSSRKNTGEMNDGCRDRPVYRVLCARRSALHIGAVRGSRPAWHAEREDIF